MSTDARPADIPETIGGRYRVLGEIGRGGMGRVLKVEHMHTGETLAMKLLFTPQQGNARAVERFKREARTLAQVRGDHVVRVIDADLAAELGGAPYIVMELLEGEDLGRLVHRRGHLDPGETVRLLRDVALGLSRVHNAGLVHRDLKPANIFLHQRDRQQVVKLLDFGLVKPAGALEDPSRALTHEGEILGTPLFMSPEQVHGMPDAIGAATDIWAVGILAYYLLTGLPYWNLRDMARGVHDIGANPLTPPSAQSRSLTVAFDAWFLRSCARNPAARWPDPITQWRELTLALGLPLAANAPQAPQTNAAEMETRAAADPASGAHAPSDQSSGRLATRQRRQVTVLFYRLALSGAKDAELDPEEFEVQERRLHAELDDALGDLRQTSTQLARGGRFVFFGYPVAYGGDARRAAEAALRVVDKVATLNAQSRTDGWGGVSVRVGIHTGVVVAGPSADTPGALDIVGPALGVATDLEHEAAPGQIITSDATWRLVGGHFAGEPIEHDRWIVRGVIPDSTSGQPSVTPMVGRDAELALLVSCLDEARAGTSQMVLVAGEVGIGKSRLVQALREHPDTSTFNVLGCQCSPYFQRTAFHPLLDLLRSIIVKMSGHAFSPSIASVDVAAIAAVLHLESTAIEALEALLSLPGAERSGIDELSPTLRRERQIHAVISLLHHLAAARPVLLIVEDLHWADPSTLEFLDRLSVLRASPLMTVLTARPDFTPSWSSPASITPITVRRLPQSQTATLIAAVAHGRLPPNVADLVARTTDGVPLFIQELTRLMAERAGDSADAIATGAVPTTLREALNARLDRLGPARAIAELASVIGMTFHIDDVRDLSSNDAGLEAKIQELVRAKVLQPQGLPPHTSYTFAHALVRDAAYGSLPREIRRALHARIAQRLAAAQSAPPEVLAYHFGEGGLPREAAGLLLQAGHGAFARSANAEARGHFQKGIELIERDTPASRELAAVNASLNITLRTMHGLAWVVSRGYAVPEAAEAFAGAMAKVKALAGEDTPDLMPALFAQWMFVLVTGRLEESAEHGARLMRLSQKAADPGAQMIAHLGAGASAFGLGRFEDASAHFDAAIGLYDPAAHGHFRFMYGQDPLMFGQVFKAWLLSCQGRSDAAATLVQRAIDHATSLHHPNSLGFALAIAGIVHQYRGDTDAVAAASQSLMTLSSEQGWLQWYAHALLWSGAAQVLRGAYDEGVATIRQARQIATSVGEKSGGAHYDAILVDALCRAGRLDEARQVLAAAMTTMTDMHELAFESELLRLEGEVARLDGRVDDARAVMTRAAESARARPALTDELRAVTSLLRLSRQTGADETIDRAEVARVLAQFTEGEATADVRDARALLRTDV